MLRDWFARIGGPDSISLTEIVAILTAIQVEIIAIQSEATALGLEVDELGFRVDGIESAPLPVDNSAEINSLSSYLYQLPISDSNSAIGTMRDELSLEPMQQVTAAVEFLQTEVRNLAEQLAAARTEIQELKIGTML